VTESNTYPPSVDLSSKMLQSDITALTRRWLTWRSPTSSNREGESPDARGEDRLMRWTGRSSCLAIGLLLILMTFLQIGVYQICISTVIDEEQIHDVVHYEQRQVELEQCESLLPKDSLARFALESLLIPVTFIFMALFCLLCPGLPVFIS
jgi:hypothetical protein